MSWQCQKCEAQQHDDNTECPWCLHDDARVEIERLSAENSRLKAQVFDIEALMQSSEGVAGLHLNGDVATWDELLPGGRFEEWLESWADDPASTVRDVSPLIDTDTNESVESGRDE